MSIDLNNYLNKWTPEYRRKYQQEYYIKNKTKLKEQRQQYYELNKKKIQKKFNNSYSYSNNFIVTFD